MIGESQKENDLFYTCSLIEYISRKTKNTKKVIVEKLKKENIEKVANEFIEKANIKLGTYDNISECKYDVPTYWDIGKVYKRLIIMVNKDESKYVETLIEVLSSWIIEKIDNYNSNMYYENPGYIYECYKNGKII